MTACSDGPYWSRAARARRAEVEERNVRVQRSRVWHMHRRKQRRIVFSKQPEQEQQVFGPHFVEWLGAVQEVLRVKTVPWLGDALTVEIPEDHEAWLDMLLAEAEFATAVEHEKEVTHGPEVPGCDGA